MWGRTVLVVLMVAACACGPRHTEAQYVHLGGGINVFSRYGYLSISMRVVPRNGTEPKWVFREPTVKLFRYVLLFLLYICSIF